MSKRHGRNTRRKMRELEERVATNLRTHMLLTERMRSIERDRPQMVTCRVIGDNNVYRPGMDNVNAKFIETRVNLPSLALQTQVDMALDLKYFDKIAEDMKKKVLRQLDYQLRACFAELVVKNGGVA